MVSPRSVPKRWQAKRDTAVQNGGVNCGDYAGFQTSAGSLPPESMTSGNTYHFNTDQLKVADDFEASPDW
jgi:hypothetical protein